VTADEYLRQILAREAVEDGPGAPVRQLEADIVQVCTDWVGDDLLEVAPGGAFEKGTANASGVAIDFIATLKPTCPTPVDLLFESLHVALEARGLSPIRRDVSIAIPVEDMLVDIVPARRLPTGVAELQLYNARTEKPFETNLLWHRHEVSTGGRQEEIRTIKLWRDRNQLDFPSFYLELTVMAALRAKPEGDLANNVWTVLSHLANLFVARAVIDPANANNIVSDMLSGSEKQQIKAIAQETLAQRSWQEIIA
jgi:hypothetical protein